MLHIVVGLSYGDESKAAVTDRICHQHKVDFAVRWGGGPNAGHTLYGGPDKVKVVLRQLPGCTYPGVAKYIIGPGCVVDFDTLVEDIRALEALGLSVRDKLLVDYRCPVIRPGHRDRDKAENGHLGTTNRGVGPCYSDFVARKGMQVGQFGLSTLEMSLREENRGVLDPTKNFVDTTEFMYRSVDPWSKTIVACGAQGAELDLIHGSWPFVTSTQVIAPSFFSTFGLGGWQALNVPTKVWGVSKFYVTKVGEGPFPTELGESEKLTAFRNLAGEYGANTGRPRKIGYLDLKALKRAVEVNGVNTLVMAKADLIGAFSEAVEGFKAYTDYDGENSCLDLSGLQPEEIIKLTIAAITDRSPLIYQAYISSSPYLDGMSEVDLYE